MAGELTLSRKLTDSAPKLPMSLRKHCVAVAIIAAVQAVNCGRFGYEFEADVSRDSVDAPNAGASSQPSGGTAGTTAASPFDGIAGAGEVVADNCTPDVPALAGDPVIDGIVEPDMDLLEVVPVGWRGPGQVPLGHGMQYAVAWRPTGLYFYMKVSDPDRNPAGIGDSTWMGDGAEIYVDADANYPPAGTWDDPGARQFSIAAPRNDQTPSVRAQRWVLSKGGDFWSTSAFACVPTPDGYDVEAFVQAADLDLQDWALAPGDRVGFNLGQNVSVPPGQFGLEGNRLAQYFMHVATPRSYTSSDFPYWNESAFCTATLRTP